MNSGYIISLFLLGVWMSVGYALKQYGECEMKNADIVIALDSSKNVNQDQFNLMKKHVTSLIKDIEKYALCRIDAIIRLITLGDGVFKKDRLSTKRMEVDYFATLVNYLPFRGKQDLDLTFGLAYAHRHYHGKHLLTGNETDEESPVKFVVYVGTGHNLKYPFYKWKSTSKKALEDNMNVFVDHVSDNPTQEEKNVFRKFIERDHPRRTSPMNTHDTYHRMQELLIKDCNECFKPTVDVAILMDNTVGIKKFGTMKKIVKGIIRRFAIGSKSKEIRVAVVSLGHEIFESEGFGLSQHKTEKDLLEAVDSIQHTDSTRTKVNAAVQHTMDNVLTSEHTRKTATKVIVYLGSTTRDRPKAEKEFAEARTKGIHTFVVGYPLFELEKAVPLAGDSYKALDGTGIVKDAAGRTVGELADIIARRVCYSSVYEDQGTPATK